MATPRDGRNTIEYLLGRGCLERIDAKTAGESAATIIGRAERRLLTAEGGLQVGDLEGAFAAATTLTGWQPKRCWYAKGCARPVARVRT